MTTGNPADAPDSSPGPAPAGQPAPATAPPALRRDLLPLPALAFIGLYIGFLAFVDIVAVVSGQFRPIYLLFAVFFLAAAGGLVFRFRWAWALTLAAVVLLAGLFFFKFYTDQQFPFIIQGFMNLVCFLYLVRPEVREKLR
jgi:hypothetical protein